MDDILDELHQQLLDLKVARDFKDSIKNLEQATLYLKNRG